MVEQIRGLLASELNFKVQIEESIEEENNFEINLVNNYKGDEFIDFSQWSNWNKLVKIILIVSLICRTWLCKCKKKINGEFPDFNL